MNLEIKRIFDSQQQFDEMKQDFGFIADAFRAPLVNQDRQVTIVIQSLLSVAFKYQPQLKYLYDMAVQIELKNSQPTEQNSQTPLDENMEDESGYQKADPDGLRAECIALYEASTPDNANSDSPTTA